MTFEIQRDRVTIIHVCPNGCEDHLSTVAHVSQDWVVDLTGSFIRTLNDAVETVAGPNDGNIWTCMECGTEADTYKAVPFYIRGEEGNSAGTLYVPLKLCSEGIPYAKAWSNDGPIVFWVSSMGDSITKTIRPCEGTENIFDIPEIGRIRCDNPCTWENNCHVAFADGEEK